MGVTTTIMIGFWLGSSYIEYRVLKAIPSLKPLFDTALGGILLSIAIGAGVSWVMGPAAGVGAALGQLLGLATNTFTYNLYNKGGELCQRSKAQYNNYVDWKDTHRNHISSAMNTIRLGLKGIGALILGFLFIVGLPFRASEATKRAWARTRNA